MVADFHNDCLTKENCEELLSTYSEGENTVVCAFFKGKRDFASAVKACELFEKYESKGKLFLAFEDFSFEDEKERETLLSFKPVCVSLTWNYDNFFAGGAKSDGKLKVEGRAFVKRLNELKIPVDCSHLNEKSFFEVAETAESVVCTHSAFAGVTGHCRNITDEQIKTIIGKGGLVGLPFYSEFLRTGGGASEEDVVRHTDYFVSKFGSDNLCIGTDFNGCEDFPDGYGNYDFGQRLANALLRLGYKSAEIEKILYKNLLTFLCSRKNRECGGQ